MPTLSAAEMDFWKAQLDFSQAIWEQNGMTGEEADGQINTMAILESYALRAWRGTGIDSWGGMHGTELIEDPTFFSNINALMALLFSRNPQPEVFATNPELKDSALKFQRFLLHAIRLPSLKIIENWNATLLDALLLKFGIIQYGFTPINQKIGPDGNLIDFYDPAQPDFPWMRRRAPWDVRIDPLVDDFGSGGDARWVAFRDLLLIDQIRKNPRFIERRDLRPTRTIKLEQMERRGQQKGLSPEENQLVEVWTIWDKVERKVFAISEGSDKTLMDPIDWPIPWRRLPYDVLQFNKTPNNAFGVAYGEGAVVNQLEINKSATMATQLMKRLRRIIPVQEDAMDESTKAMLASGDMDLAEIFMVKASPREVIGQIQLGGGIQELLLHIGDLRNTQRILLGVSEFDRAQRVNVETATEAGAIAQGSQVQRSRNQGPWETFLSNSIDMFAQGVQHLVAQENRPRVVPILGDEDAMEIFGDPTTQRFVEITPQEVQGSFIYRVRPGSTLPEDPAEEQRREVAFTQLMASAEPLAQLTNWPQRAVDMTRAFDKDPKKQLMGQELGQATQRVEQQRQAAGQSPPPNEQQGSPPSQGVDPRLLQSLNGGGG